jgi:putative ATPase
LAVLARLAAGDARRALSDLERCIEGHASEGPLDADQVVQILQRSDIRHDRSGEDHFNVVSALIKSLRGSDPDAALYWLARMIEGGEDPLYIARRLIVFASEDIGNADPRALAIAVDTAQALQLIGLPEGRIILGQAVTWLACCPKSNASYVAIDKALADVRSHGALPVPLHLRNASTRLMKEEGYGQGYKYPHNHPHNIVDQPYFPDRLQHRRYYDPVPHGEEKTIRERLAWWRRKLGQDT